MGTTEDLVDIFDEFAEYLKEVTGMRRYLNNIGATGVYVGRLEQTKKEIKEGDNDSAHIDEAGLQVIRYISATKDHSFIVGKALKMTEGVTPDVFHAPETAPASNEPAAEEGKEPQKKDDSKEEAKPVESEEFKQTVYRPEVTRETRMKFFKVPRLGCYLAVPLIYSSCLFTEALDSAVTDFVAYREKLKKNEESMKEYEEKLAQEKADNEEEDPNKSVEKSKDKPTEKSVAKVKEVEEHSPAHQVEERKIPPPKLDEIKEPEYKTRPVSYVVCMDTLGQDREFTPEQKNHVTEMIKKYKNQWEERERIRLTSDRKLKEEERAKDTEFIDKSMAAVHDEEEKLVEEQMTTVSEEMSEEDKKAREKLLHCEYKIKQITAGNFKDRVLALSNYNVVKMPRIMQTLFYLLGYTKDQICEPDTNKLFWKKARVQWNEALLTALKSYTPVGPKNIKCCKYQTINFLEKNLEGINEEDVRAYSLGLSKLFACLQTTLEVRKEDIFRRKAKRERLHKEREEAIQKSEQRTKERAEELRVKKEEALKVKDLFKKPQIGLDRGTAEKGG